MKNSVICNKNYKHTLQKEHKEFNKEDILSFFYKSCKEKNAQKIGMEYERLPLDAQNFKRRQYLGKNGIKELLTEFCELYRWEKIFENNNIIGATKNGISISLEPGAQLEISTSPNQNIYEIEKEIIDTDKLLLPLCAKHNITLTSMGVAPYENWTSITLIPKKRYHIMDRLLSGAKARVMMRETAGIQATFDFHSEIDAITKLKLGLMLSPITTAMFANSPFHNGQISEYKSFRASAWLETDEKRCGLIDKNLFTRQATRYNFEQYVDKLLDIPLLYFVREKKYIEPKEVMSFKFFMQHGYEGFYPSMDDFLLHLNLFFPEVRLRNYIEIRNHDSLAGKIKYAPVTLYKALLYNESTKETALEIFKKLSYEDFVTLRENVPKYALKTPIGKNYVIDYAKEILSLAQETLSKNSDVDEIYLEEISELINKGKTPADILIKNKKNFLL